MSQGLATVRCVTTGALPADIVGILEYLATLADVYDNCLKWDEEARLKAGLMHNRRYWMGVSVWDVRTKCLELGMSHEDVRLIADLVTRAQEGRRLIPHRVYRDSTFRHDQP